MGDPPLDPDNRRHPRDRRNRHEQHHSRPSEPFPTPKTGPDHVNAHDVVADSNANNLAVPGYWDSILSALTTAFNKILSPIIQLAKFPAIPFNLYRSAPTRANNQRTLPPRERSPVEDTGTRSKPNCTSSVEADFTQPEELADIPCNGFICVDRSRPGTEEDLVNFDLDELLERYRLHRMDDGRIWCRL